MVEAGREGCDLLRTEGTGELLHGGGGEGVAATHAVLLQVPGSKFKVRVRSPVAGALLVVAFEAALLLVDFFAAPGVAHEPEAAGGVDLEAGLGLEEDWETGSGGDWETGGLGDWGTGRLGDDETMRL